MDFVEEVDFVEVVGDEVEIRTDDDPLSGEGLDITYCDAHSSEISLKPLFVSVIWIMSYHTRRVLKKKWEEVLEVRHFRYPISLLQKLNKAIEY